MNELLQGEHEEGSHKHRKKFRSEFMNWLESNSSFFWTQFLALLGFVTAILEVPAHFKEIFKEEQPDAIQHGSLIGVFIIQCVFILLVIFFLNGKSFGEEVPIDRYKKYFKTLLGKHLTKDQEKAARKVTDLNLNIFARYWLLFWKWIFLLYAVLSLHDLFNIKNEAPVYFIISSVLQTFLNNFSMANLFLCFLIIQNPLNSLHYDELDLDKQFNRFLNNKSMLYTITIGFSVLHLLALLVYFLKIDYPFAKEMAPIIRENAAGVNLFFKIISGIFNCLSLALLIARLDSKIINVPSVLISVLVLYAAVQPLYVFFDNEKYKLIVLVISAFTLAFKIYFYLIVAYIINTHRLTDLFFTFPLIKKLIEEDGYGKEGKSDAVSHNVEAFNKHLDLMSLILRASGYSSYKYRKKMATVSADGLTTAEVQ